MKNIFAQALLLHATDIHIKEQEAPVFRIRGRLVRQDCEVVSKEQLHSFLATHITDVLWQQEIIGCDRDRAFSLNDTVRVRMNIYRHYNGLAVAMRLLYPLPPLGEDKDRLLLERLSQRSDGLVLITGVTGSGKSTTIAHMIDYINKTQAKHIITLEDPVEYIFHDNHSFITQRQIYEDALDFTTALRSAMREDPDVIMIGEMRDPETMNAAITAAETGHLVLATLHTRKADEAISRIINAFTMDKRDEARQRLSQVLAAVLTQQLLQENSIKVLREVLINTPAVANLIRNQKDYQLRSLMQTGVAYGMKTMEQSELQLLTETGARK